MQIAQPGMNIDQDKQMLMVEDNVGNTFRPNEGQIVGNQNGYNVVQNSGNGNVVAAWAEGDLDEIEKVNANCILMANLQQASTSGTQTDNAPVYDSDGSAELFEPISEPHQVQQNDINVISAVSSVEQSRRTVEQNPSTIEETQAAKFIQDFKSLAKEADKSLVKHKALEYEIKRLLKAVVSQIERLQAQLEDLKGKSKDTLCVSYTLDPLSQKLEDKNVALEFQVLNYAKENEHLKTTYKNLFDSIKVTRDQTKLITHSLHEKLHDTIYENATLRAQLFDKVSKQKNTTKGERVDTKFSKQSILGKPPSSSGPKLYSVNPLPKSKVIPKVGESNALSKPVTSNSAPSSQESTVVINERVIALGIFRINPFKASRVDNFVPNKHVKASIRTTPITVSQPYVITKKDVNSNTNGFSPKDIKALLGPEDHGIGTILRMVAFCFVVAFCLLRFASGYVLLRCCILPLAICFRLCFDVAFCLIEDPYCVLPRGNLSISFLDCVLTKDTAFCPLKTLVLTKDTV
ncbi:hypothetical protein Tco_1284940 [Tanacetum coccineum]